MKNNFFTTEEIKISREFRNKGYIIRNAADNKSLSWIQSKFIKLIKENYKIDNKISALKTLNIFHKKINKKNLNSFRLKIFNKINNDKNFRLHYYKVAKPFLEAIVGNELAMQKRVNLSIQLPKDPSSLLVVHSDTWAGDSPFEVVVWVPLVNCFKTKSMYILPANKYNDFHKRVSKKKYTNSEKIYQSIKKHINWLKIDYGQILIFNQSLPHGNRINKENETRWSMNCRFKNIFSPYGDKKIGEFFEPITLKPASEIGLKYKFPKIK
tara:strand:- start:851 stop:1654 length:804 start_codon:yes stop_codon:yes gene_type:complete